MRTPQPSTALAKLRVLDLTRVRAGPTCCRILGDFGADVIKIEAPPGVDPNEGMSGARDGSDMLNLHRNKRSLTLNLKERAGHEIFMRLVKDADVVVENFRPDVKERMGIEYDALNAVNPRIILASISGFGQSGPYRTRAGFDQIAQGMGGLMWVTGMPGEGPMRAGIAVADSSAGIYAATGILIALAEREHSGRGQWVQTSLLEAQIALMDFQAAIFSSMAQYRVRQAMTILIRRPWAFSKRPTDSSISASAAMASGARSALRLTGLISPRRLSIQRSNCAFAIGQS
jgi:crotonobetainyl-CoA:carnitine CoA-transferase CaiB-like acyl-CoA transferase